MWWLIGVGIMLYLMSQQQSQQVRRIVRRSKREDDMNLIYKRQGNIYNIDQVDEVSIREPQVPLPPEPPTPPAPPVPPTPIPTGNWYSILTSPGSYKCNQNILNFQGGVLTGYGRGYYHGAYPDAVSLPRNGTLYFIIDPGSVGFTGTKFKITIMDLDQSPIGISKRLITVDGSGNELTPPNSSWTSMGNGLPQQAFIYVRDHAAGRKYIVEIKESGTRSATVSLYWGT